MELSAEELRDTITGKMPWRRCPDCEGTGTEYWMEYTLKESPRISDTRMITAQQAADFQESDWPDYDWVGVDQGECENCKGVGYVRCADLMPAHMASLLTN